MAKRKSIAQEMSEEKTFHLRKEDRIELAAIHFATQGAKQAAQAAINAAQALEKTFNDKLTGIRADLGIVEKENLGIDLDAGIISVRSGDNNGPASS